MKKLILILGLFIAASSCSQNEENTKTENSIFGTWKLIAVNSNVGDGQNSWNSLKNGYSFSINKDGSFESTKYDDCNSGMINANNSTNILSFIFDCDKFYPCVENSNSCNEYFSFDKNNLILSASYQNCDEGCPQFKFEKIK